MTVGSESIQFQHDDVFLSKIDHIFYKIKEVVRSQIPDIDSTVRDNKMSYKDYDKFKYMFKKSMLTSIFKELDNIIFDRFNIHIKLNHKSSGIHKIAYIILPMLDYKLTNIVIQDLDSLFPKKKANSILWNLSTSKIETNTYNILNEIKTSLQNNKLRLDFENGRIYGLENSEFIVNMDFIAMGMLHLTEKEMTSILLHEIGHIFTYVEYMSVTTNNTFTLIDTFINERFGKSNDPVNSLRIALDKTDTDVSLKSSEPTAIIEALDVFIIKTYRYNKRKESINIDFENESDKFVNRLGYGDHLASAIIKINTIDFNKNTESTYSRIGGFILTTFKYIAFLGMFLTLLLTFNVLGIFMLFIIVGIQILSFLLKTLLKSVIWLFKLFFSSDIDQDVNNENIVKRLNKLKLDLIKKLRTLDLDNDEKKVIIEQIDFIKNSIDKVSKKFIETSNISKTYRLTSESNTDKINEILEELENNEGYLMKDKLSMLNKKG